MFRFLELDLCKTSSRPAKKNLKKGSRRIAQRNYSSPPQRKFGSREKFTCSISANAADLNFTQKRTGKMGAKMSIEGVVSVWSLLNNSRRFATIVVPFEKAVDAFKPTLYNGKTGRGEQREIHLGHSRKLQREIKQGTYTPTPIAVGTRKEHRNAIRYSEDGRFELELDLSSPLPLTDGGHRFEAIKSVLTSLVERQKVAKDDSEKEILGKQIEEVYKLPISATIYLDGDLQVDFVNLQQGRPVDQSHMMTMRIRRDMASSPDMVTAFEIAKALASAESGPYVGQIRFDSRGKMALPLSTLSAKGSGDLSTSLVGLSRVNEGTLKPEEVASVFSELLKRLKAECQEVLSYGKVLTPIGDGGTKGSSTMLIGVVICLVHDIVTRSVGVDGLRYEDAINAIKQTLNRQVAGSFTSVDKREMMGDFATAFFSNSNCEKYEDVPLSLLKKLSCNSYSCTPLAKSVKVPEQAAEQAGKTEGGKTPKNSRAPKKPETPTKAKRVPKRKPKAQAEKKADAEQKVEELPKVDEKKVVPATETQTFDSPDANPWDLLQQA